MKELIKAIGKKGYCDLGGVSVRVEVVDVKSAYGRDLYQVTPIEGTGTVWISKVSGIE